MKEGPALVVLTRRYYPLSNALLGVGIYLAGFLISFFSNFPDFFVAVWYFLFAMFGITWVSALWNRAYASMYDLSEELCSIFEAPAGLIADEYQKFVREASNDGKALLFSIPGFVFAGYFFWLLQNRKILLPFKVPEAAFNNAALSIYILGELCFVAYLVLASVYIILQGIFFLKKIAKYPVRIQPLQIRRKVHFPKLNRMLLVGTSCWFVGVWLVMTVLLPFTGVFLVPYTSVFNLFFLGFVGFGVVVFFIPQVVLHNAIAKSKDNLLSTIQRGFFLRTTLPLCPSYNVMEAQLLSTMFDQVERISEWPLEITTILRLLSPVVIPVVTYFPQLMSVVTALIGSART